MGLVQKLAKIAKVRKTSLAYYCNHIDVTFWLIAYFVCAIQNLTMTPEAKIEATMQHEITRLTSENLVSLGFGKILCLKCRRSNLAKSPTLCSMTCYMYSVIDCNEFNRNLKHKFSLLQDLREHLDRREDQIKKLKKALKIYARRLKSTEGQWCSEYYFISCHCYISRWKYGLCCYVQVDKVSGEDLLSKATWI